MSATSQRLLVLLNILITCLQGQAQNTVVITFFLPDSEPRSLEASVVAVNTQVNPQATYETGRVTTLVVDCPKADSPDNAACRSIGIYPAQVYHTQGSVWGGTTTFLADNSTTSWRCELGNPWATGGLISTRSGDGAVCSKTIVASGATRMEATAFDPCYRAAHQLPIVVTAGGEKLDPANAWMDIDAAEADSIKSSDLSSMDCPSTTETLWIVYGSSTGLTSGSATETLPTKTSPTSAPIPSTPVVTSTELRHTEGSASVAARPSGNAAVSLGRTAGSSYFLWGTLMALISYSCLLP
jgi:hypothetical protein